MAITSIGGPKKRSKTQIFPSFLVKITQKNPPHLEWGSFTVSMFSLLSLLSQSLPFLALVFHLFPLLLDFLRPKSGPSNEVMGGFSYSGGTDFLKSLLQNFQPRRQWCIKFLLPWAQKFYTPLFCVSVQFNREGGSGFGSWKTVPAVPVPLSVSGKTVPTVPASGSGSVPEPPC